VPLRRVAGWAGAGRQRVWRHSEFRRRVRCEGLGYAVGLHRTTTVWRLDLLGRRIGDPVAVGDLADAIGRGGFRRVTWREGTKGKMSSRFATERVVLAQDDLVDPSQRESGLAAHGMAAWREGSDGLYRDHVAGEHVTAPARSESQAAVAHRTGVRGRQGRAWLDHYEGRSFRGWNHHVSMCWFASRLSSPSAPGFSPLGRKKLPRGKRRIVTTGADGNPPGAALPGFLHHCAPGRRARPATWLPDAPVSQTAIDGTAWCTAVNTDGRLPF